MRVDEAGHHHGVACIDALDAGMRGTGIGADRGDRIARHDDVRAIEARILGVAGDDAAALDHEGGLGAHDAARSATAPVFAIQASAFGAQGPSASPPAWLAEK